MNVAPDEMPVLDYSVATERRSTSRVSGRELLVAICLVAAVGFALNSYVKVARGWWTPPYAQYRVAQELQRRSQPGYVGPPFVGRMYEYESMWEVGTTYLALAMVAAGGGIVAAGVLKSRRRRRLDH